jgi:hypothetical protein
MTDEQDGRAMKKIPETLQTALLAVALFAGPGADLIAADKPASEAPGNTTIIRCEINGKVTLTDGKCEGGNARVMESGKALPPVNQIKRTGPAAPRPMAALPPLSDSIQVQGETSQVIKQDQCAIIDKQLSGLDAQATLALPLPESEPNRKRRDELQRKRFAMRCG